ncbi:MAG: tolB protein precursor protein [Myxococcales bacterium]|nr:tolB protein precursor protein [Myxococcales bacterium]
MPVTALPVSALPVTALPVSALPVTALPVSALPVTSDCSAGHVAFVSERDGNREIYAICPDGTQLTRLTKTPASSEHLAASSPSGLELVLVVTRGEAGSPEYDEALALLSLTNGAVRPVGKAGRRARNPSVFPNGTDIVFESAQYGFSDLVLVGQSGASTRLTTSPSGSFEPAASPDGTRIAFVSSREGNAEIFTMAKDGRDVRRLTWQRGEDTQPTWSPDGRSLAFASSRGGTPRLHVMGAAGEKPRALGAIDDSVLADRSARFSPDGATLAYLEDRGTSASIRIVNASDGALIADTRGTQRDEAPVWSPSGNYLVFASNRDGDVELYRMRADGTGVTRLTQSPGADWLPLWVR